MSNLSSYVHKFYLFTAVEYFGLFLPQGVLCVIAFTFAFIIRKKFLALDQTSKDQWAVTDTILQKVKAN